MTFTGDERAQSVQVGAVLLFGVLIIAFSSYQAFAVPEQNREVEFNHNQEVQTQLQDLRNAVVSVPGETSSQSISVTLGTQYPSRAIARNPGPPSGALRTNGTADSRHNVTIRNAQADGETGDYWTGTSPKRFNSGTLVYSPNYNVYGEAPATYYEHSLAYNQFRSGNVALSGQTLVNGREISIVTLNGSLSRTSSGTASVDVQPISQSSRTVSVTDDGTNNVSISFLSRLPASAWNETLSEEVDTSPGNGDDDRYIADVSDQPGPGPYYNITLTFERGVDYRLQMAKAGVGTRVSDEEATYLTDVEGDGSTVNQGEKTEFVVEVRDDYNNPVADTNINASVSGTNNGTLAETRKQTDDEGRVTLTYESTANTDAGTHNVQITLGPESRLGGGFDETTVENLTMTVTVQNAAADSGGRLLYLNDGSAFDADGDSVAGAFNLTVVNQVEQPIEITDVTVVPENSDINGISDEVSGEGPGQSELAVENLQTGDTRTVEIPLTPNEEYGYISDRGIVLSTEGPREELIYNIDDGELNTVETDIFGSSFTLGINHEAEITFAEFHEVSTSTAQPVNVTDESFRIAVTYLTGSTRISDEFVVNVQPPSANGGGGNGGTASDVSSGFASDLDSDSQGEGPTQEQTIDVTLGDDLSAGEEITIDLTDTDRTGGASISYSNPSTTEPGTVSLNNRLITYSPAGSEASGETITITVDATPKNNAGGDYTVVFDGDDGSSAQDTFTVN